MNTALTFAALPASPYLGGRLQVTLLWEEVHLCRHQLFFVAIVKMAASVGSPSPPALVVLAPGCLLPDSRLISLIKQPLPVAAPPPATSPNPVPPPLSAVVHTPSNRGPPSNTAPAARARGSDFSVAFLLSKKFPAASPAEDLRTIMAPLVLQQSYHLLSVVQSQKQGGRS